MLIGIGNCMQLIIKLWANPSVNIEDMNIIHYRHI